MTDEDILQDLAAQIREEAISAALDEEQQLQRSVIRHCKQAFAAGGIDSLMLSPNPRASQSNAVSEYWRGISSTVIDLFRPSLELGEQPVFAGISLLTTSTGYTVFVPIPYREGCDLAALKAALWLNPEHSTYDAYEATCVEPAVRAVSHALANISYSVWIQDKPNRGWLALAHASPDPIYIPDVRELHDATSADAETEATSEEPHLGMASVLYVPLCDFEPSQETPAPAVLMLWSPVPGRWDGRFANSTSMKSRSGHTQVWRLEDGLAVGAKQALWREFQWTEHVAARDHANYGLTELQVMNFLLALLRWQRKQHGIVQKTVGEFIHGIDKPILNLASKRTDSSVRVRDWASDILTGTYGFVQRATRGYRDLSKTPLILKMPLFSEENFSVADARQLIDRLDTSNMIIPLDRETANDLAAEPASNIIKYAKSIDAIEISVTDRYATVDYRETPTDAAIDAFKGSAGFLRYFAIRRGLPVAPVGGAPYVDGTGLGLWISRLLEARKRSVSRLYVSADLRHWSTSVIMAVERESPQEAAHV